MEAVNHVLTSNGYEYVKFLGNGGFSDVFLCYSKKYNKEFAIKRTVKHKLTDFEYKNLACLNNKNIIRLYDIFEDETAQYLVIDYCPNGTMKMKGNLPYLKFVYYAKQILEVVAYCHLNNIAHRDIKPDNIFIDQYDTVKLADFGMANKFENGEKSSEKCGTLKYLSPEMLSHSEVDPFKADIWALGITFFFMATGKFPFENKSREKLEYLIIKGEINFTKYGIDHRIQYLLKKMLNKSLEDRPTAEKLLEFPIFHKNALSEKIFGKSEIVGHKMQSCSNIEKANPAFINENKINNNELANKVQLIDLHSYKYINCFQSCRKLNDHFVPIKTFYA